MLAVFRDLLRFLARAAYASTYMADIPHTFKIIIIIIIIIKIKCYNY